MYTVSEKLYAYHKLFEITGFVYFYDILTYRVCYGGF